MLSPSSTFFSTSLTIFSNACSSPLCPLDNLYIALTEEALKSGCFIYLTLSRSSFEIIGF